jgi:hypothetical protein
LAFLHTGDVVFEADLIFTRLASAEAEELGNLSAVCSVFVDTEFEVLGVLLVELLVILLVLHEFGEHSKTVLNDVLLDDLKDLVLLEGLTRDVERKIF